MKENNMGIEQDILKYFQKYSGSKNATLDSKVYHDLGLFGLDILEILDNIVNKYSINFEDFDYDKFFPKESDMLIFKSLWYWLINKKYPPKIPITIRHIVEVAKKGKWFDPNVEAE